MTKRPPPSSSPCVDDDSNMTDEFSSWFDDSSEDSEPSFSQRKRPCIQFTHDPKVDQEQLAVFLSGDISAMKACLAADPAVLEKKFQLEDKILRPLAIVAGRGDFTATYILLQSGADMDADQGLALKEAVFNQHEVVVQLFLDKGATIQHYSPIDMIMEKNNLALARLFAEHKNTSLEVKDKMLNSASWYGCDAIVQYLLEYRASACLKLDFEIALFCAIRKQHTTIVSKLLEHGANPNLDKDYLTNAVDTNNKEIVNLLLAYKANVHANNDFALWRAVLKNQTEITKLLLEHGANVHRDKDSLLRYAASYGSIPMIELLLDYQADIHVYNDAPLSNALEKERFEIAECLLVHGADLHAEHDRELVRAAKLGRIKTVEFFLQHQDAAHIHVDEALHEAILNNHLEVALLLLERGARLDFSRSLAKEWIHKSSTEQVENVVLQWYEAQVEKINPLVK